MINPFIVEASLKQAFIEDNHYIDVTSDLLLPAHHMAEGQLIAKEAGIICGVEVADRAFRLSDDQCEILWTVKDGDAVSKGQCLMTIKGTARGLLKAERIALNFLQRMSGIATMTHHYVSLIKGTSLRLVDTRKTTPLFRPFEKYSVLMGGGFNHRYNLSDSIMLKDNHIAVFGSITKAIDAARSKSGHTLKVEVEVERFEQFQEALEAQADIIMLDNMPDDLMRQCVALRDTYHRNNGSYVILEASGNITDERLPILSTIGIDVVSSGALTHSYKALDISLKFFV